MVNLVWSLTNGGTSITSTNHGSADNGAATTVQTLYLRHDGVNQITSAALYVKPYTGSYTGAASAAADFAEIVAWGDGATATSFGGFLINQDATGSFPSGVWPVWNSKSPTYGSVIRTGVGNSSANANAITLSSRTGCTSDGVVQVGSSPNVRFQCKVVVPVDEDTVGARQLDMALLYSYTS